MNLKTPRQSGHVVINFVIALEAEEDVDDIVLQQGNTWLLARLDRTHLRLACVF
jgi:hypothetical protein